MDARCFDDVTRSLTDAPSRRGFLAGLAAFVAPATAGAGNRKKRKKKPKRNAFGCVNVGGACFGKDELCCSGICAGKKPKKGKRDKRRCVGHDAGNCQTDQNVCENPPAFCATTQDALGACRRTTGNAEFCTSEPFSDISCTKDEECVEECGEGAACVLNCDDEPVCMGLAISCGAG